MIRRGAADKAAIVPFDTTRDFARSRRRARERRGSPSSRRHRRVQFTVCRAGERRTLDAASTADVGNDLAGRCRQRRHRPVRHDARLRAQPKTNQRTPWLSKFMTAPTDSVHRLSRRREAYARRCFNRRCEGHHGYCRGTTLIPHVKGMPFQAQRLPFCRCAYFMGRAA